eukprot:m.261034 g.261034  ORF g.261034 m.261034 type:complete len:963 (+) comp15570_c0_seq2:394-3282(+)
MAEAVKVAVRVRPFNSREEKLGAVNIIEMNGCTTVIKDPKTGKKKTFTYDYSYWSHDSFTENGEGYLEPTSPQYADQAKVFDDLGQGVLDNAWKGFNCSLFAYGQTGSGKSYSMMGYGANKGIIPISCERLFQSIDARKGKDLECEVTFSMVEIYNEQVQDLLTKEKVKNGLKVRGDMKKGFHVAGLMVVPVQSYEEIEGRIAEGTKNRTIASTNMNATSSRAHTIVTINFKQKSKNEKGVSMTKTSSINLVDLAGSERAESTGATGDRLKEGAAINLSLSTLGNVISALVDQQNGSTKVVPFRDSVLTKLLKNALGGNSKSVMIAALSPASVNYPETLSTLQFADRMKSIKTKAVVNESPTERLIRELREENARLLGMIKNGQLPPSALGGGTSADGDDSEEEHYTKEELEAQLQANARELEKSWEEKLKDAQKHFKETAGAEAEEQKKKETVPHFWNLNADPALTGVISHFVETDMCVIGNGQDDSVNIVLKGLGICSIHCEVTTNDGVMFLKDVSGKDAVYVDGAKIGSEAVEIHHNSRVLFGPSHLYVFSIPNERKAGDKVGKKWPTPTYAEAQQEISIKSGLTTELTESDASRFLLEEIVSIAPHVIQANAIAQELKKNVAFQIEVKTAMHLDEQEHQVQIRMHNEQNGSSLVFGKDLFLEKRFVMQEMYNAFMDHEEWHSEDPFFIDPAAFVEIGEAQVVLYELVYNLDIMQTVPITAFGSLEGDVGKLTVAIAPCNATGAILDPNTLPLDIGESVGQDAYYRLEIKNVSGLSPIYKNLYCEFSWHQAPEPTTTTVVPVDMKGTIDYQAVMPVCPVSDDFIKWLQSRLLTVMVKADQQGSRGGKPGHHAMPKTSSFLTSFINQAEFEDTLLVQKQMAAAHLRRAQRAEAKLKRVRELLKGAKGDSVQVKEVQRAMQGQRFKGAVRSIMVLKRVGSNLSSPDSPAGDSTGSAACTVM